MSYVGCIGSPIAETGLLKVLNYTFGGVPRMLNEEKFPQHVCVLRILIEELLRPGFDESAIISIEDFDKMLTKITESS